MRVLAKLAAGGGVGRSRVLDWTNPQLTELMGDTEKDLEQTMQTSDLQACSVCPLTTLGWSVMSS